MKSQSVTPKPDAELAKWCQIIDDTLARTDEVPEGWLIASDLAIKLNKAPSTMGRLLALAVRGGTAERKNFRINIGSGVRSVPHYRPK